MSDMTDPLPLATQAAVETHEQFTAYIQAGFTRKEALYLVGEQVKALIVVASQAGSD